MKVDFYEEFPTRENLSKLKLVKFPTRVFVAARSLKDFQRLKRLAKANKKDLEVAYWPILENSYWISPFSNSGDLRTLFNSLERMKDPILIDLEMPLTSKWKMYFKNFPHFGRNKSLIKKFIEKNKSRVTTAEYSHVSAVQKSFLGLGYDVNCERSLMFYTSTFSERKKEKIGRILEEIADKSNYSISLGTIAPGVFGGEPELSPRKLEKDLEFVKKAGFEKVIIFRVGGLNRAYLEVLNKYANVG